MRVLIAVLCLFAAQAVQANTTPEQRTQKATMVLKEMSAIPENSIPERLLAEAVGSAGGEGGVASLQDYVGVYSPAMIASFGVGVFFLLIAPLVNKMMHGVR